MVLALQTSRIRPSVAAPAKFYRDSLDAAANLDCEAPVLCFSPATLTARANLFIQGFPGEVAYAVKANPCPQVMQVLARAGIGVFDVASTMEMETIARSCPGAKLHYHNPVKSRGEIATAWHAFGCRRFAADSHEEITKISQTIGPAGGAEIAIRFCLSSHGASAHDFSGKFGVDEKTAAGLMKHAAQCGFSPLLTFHPGSQCTDPQVWCSHIEAAGRIARDAGIVLTRLNVGGGFPARYSASAGPDLATYFQTIQHSVSSVFGNNRPELECEPGRSIAAPAFSLLTSVKLVRERTGDLFLNDGIYGGLLEVTQVPDLLPFYRVLRNGQVVVATDQRSFAVFGPTCDPLDVLPVTLTLPSDIRESDIIEFAGIGAYGMATATSFNGYGSVSQVTVETAYTG
ncbi:ornithine decarboxylase [Anderseniella sp. Alg231-50]|uniref:ornithine decarboxylase n=1 Tax=Anderseniella sp. Alg231-50 TaxID=1922226 RepID=UPI000D54CCA5